MHRASTLSSNGVERVAEEKKIMEALGDNGYPLGFIRRHSDNRTSRRTEDDQRLPKTSLTLPYIGGLSEAVRTLLRPLDIKVALRPLRTLCHQLAHPKDHVPRSQQAGVVYQILCSDCPKAYNGQPRRTLKHGLSEHRRALQSEDVAASALAEHTWSTGHRMGLSKAEVVDAQPFVTTRCLLESWHIQRHTCTLNCEKGTMPREYTALLD